ncbi:SH3 domain-containing protein [Cytobacillus suaedae]|nr:SH3 domain-containing protein [Cytobacillus suaedae]
MKKKNMFIAGSLAVGIGMAAFIPNSITASNNVILASVDWVNTQINPMKSQITALETKINQQQQEINSLKQQIANGGGTTTPTPAPAPSPGAPSTSMPTTIYVAKASATIHSGATASYKVVATKKAGSALKVIDQHTSSTGTWYRVEVSSTVKGWIFSGNVSTSKDGSVATSPSKVITTGEVHLRKGATTAYAVLETLKKGTTLKHLQTFTNAKGETWYNVETATGKRGWIYGNFGEVS